MSHILCPWWLGYLLVSPLRRLQHNPATILSPFVTDAMWVLEPGPGMGFFTLELARLAGPKGRVFAVDVQPRMIAVLERRARKAGLRERIETRLSRVDSLGVEDLEGKIDFALAFAMIHELPDAARFLDELRRALKTGGKALVVELKGHVKQAEFTALQESAWQSGFQVTNGPAIRASWSSIWIRE